MTAGLPAADRREELVCLARARELLGLERERERSTLALLGQRARHRETEACTLSRVRAFRFQPQRLFEIGARTTGIAGVETRRSAPAQNREPSTDVVSVRQHERAIPFGELLVEAAQVVESESTVHADERLRR